MRKKKRREKNLLSQKRARIYRLQTPSHFLGNLLQHAFTHSKKMESKTYLLWGINIEVD